MATQGIKLGKDGREALDTNLSLLAQEIDDLVSGVGLADNSITNAKLRDSAGTSVIGRSAGSTGDPADIVATADGQILTRAAGVLVFASPSTPLGWDPDIEPATGLDTARSDNFNGGQQISWTAFNSGPTSTVHDRDGREYHQTGEASNIRGHYAPGGANSADFSIFTRLHAMTGANYSTAGLVLLGNGSWAAPTQLVWVGHTFDSANGFGTLYMQTFSSYTAFSSHQGFINLGPAIIYSMRVYLWVKYVAATKVVTCYGSASGDFRTWALIGTQTLTNHPEFGTFVNANTGVGAGVYATFKDVRCFTSGVNSASADQYANGEMGG